MTPLKPRLLCSEIRTAPDDASQSLLQAAIGQMSDEQAVAAANSIFTLYARLTLKR
jgi:hypothetical protein